jgi:2-dehydro-3-deoxygalactonokinase
MNGMAKYNSMPFVAVDWGTTSFRAALISSDGEILDEIAHADKGILQFRRGEFAPFLVQISRKWTKQGAQLFLLSGMIGSRDGMMDAPYCPCPLDAAMLASKLSWAVPERVAIVPGVCMGNPLVGNVSDVMRGEETQVIGAAVAFGIDDALVVVPGAHSKWVSLEHGRIASFQTFMTGEFYRLLSEESILARSVQEMADSATMPLGSAWTAEQQHFFLEGVEIAARNESLLSTAFTVRVRSLMGNFTATQAASYLAGLVIGEELAGVQMAADEDIIIIGSQASQERYALALEHRGLRARKLGSQAAWAGLHQVYLHLVAQTG